MEGIFKVEVVIVLEEVTLEVVSMGILIDVEAGFKIVEILVVLAILL